MPVRRAVFVAAILPATLAWLAKVVVFPRPFWVFFYDPEPIYFYSGLRLLRGLVPENVDNPGTPLQVLSALVAAITGRTPLAYERFLLVAHTAAFLFTLAATLLLLRTVLRDAPPLLQVCGAWLYWLAPQAVERIDIWSPEVLFFPIGAVALSLLWRWWRDPSPPRAAALGLSIGLAVAIKYVFLGWVVAAVAAVAMTRRWRDLLAVMASLAAGFVVGTLPVVRQYPFMLRRLLTLTAPGGSMLRWTDAVATSRMWLVCVAAVAVLAAVRFRRQQVPLLAFSVTAIVFTFLGARTNLSFRYLLPAAMAVVILLAMAAMTPPRLPVQIALTALFAIAMVRIVGNDLTWHRQRIEEGLALHAAIDAAVPDDGVVLYSWRVPEPSFALRTMTTERRYHDVIASAWPREGHYNDWTGQIVLPPGVARWDYLVIAPDILRSFPEPVGPRIGSAGPYGVYRASYNRVQ